MAGSRLDKIGNIFSRLTGLLRCGTIKYEDRPLWYDVYRVFPPKYEPRFNRELEAPDVQPILYTEDLVRAEFLKKYELNPGGLVRNLTKYGENDVCQNFITKYNEVQKSHPTWTHEEIFESVSSKFTISTPRGVEIGGPRSSRYASPSSSQLTEDQEDEAALNRAIRRRPKTGIISPTTLKAMFKEAKGEEEEVDTIDEDDNGDDSKKK